MRERAGKREIARGHEHEMRVFPHNFEKVRVFPRNAPKFKIHCFFTVYAKNFNKQNQRI